MLGKILDNLKETALNPWNPLTKNVILSWCTLESLLSSCIDEESAVAKCQHWRLQVHTEDIWQCVCCGGVFTGDCDDMSRELIRPIAEAL